MAEAKSGKIISNPNTPKPFLTPKGRLVTFGNSLFEARDFNGDGKFSYSAIFLFDKEAQDTPLFKAMLKERDILRKLLEAELVKFRKSDAEAFPVSGIRNPIERAESKSNYSGFDAGMLFINPRRSKNNPPPPQVVGKQKNRISLELGNTDEIYSGCYARASLSAFAYIYSKGSYGISFGLNNVQKIDDGQTLGGMSRADEDFTPIGEDVAETAATGNVEDVWK